MTSQIAATDRLIEIDLFRLISNRYQPRKQFDDEELDELAASIQDVGLLSPPLVRKKEESDFYEIIAGERRVLACKKLGFTKILVYISELNLQHSAEAALIENIQRVDLNPIEIALSCKQLIDEFNINQESLAQKIGKKRSTVANYLRLLQLPMDMQQALATGKIQVAHAKVLLSELDPEKRKALFIRVIQDELSVQKLEQLQKTNNKTAVKNIPSDIYLNDLQELLERKMGTKVEIKGDGNNGSIIIHYYSLSDLDRVIEILVP